MSSFPSAPPPPGTGAGGQPATFVQRLVAYLIDAAVSFVLLIPGYMVVAIGLAIGGAFGALVVLVGVALILAGIVAAILIFIVGQGATGQTPGKRTQGIQLLKSGTGQPIGGLMVFVRGILAQILGSVCFIGYLWMLIDPEKKTLYDKLMDNEVVLGRQGGIMPLFPDGKPF